jgi:hypothetical protein
MRHTIHIPYRLQACVSSIQMLEHAIDKAKWDLLCSRSAGRSSIYCKKNETC